jgi:hypothetical protein
MNSTTPRRITDPVREFCREIVPEGEPVYLNVQSTTEDIALDCFANVDRHIVEAGGAIQYGWRIWEWPNTMIEAEFHAVWRTQDGSLIDTTPTPDGEQRVLFLPDMDKVYSGQQINNIRKALVNNSLLDEYLHNCNARFRIYNEGERANRYEILLTVQEANALQTIEERNSTIEAMLSPCPCGSGVRFHRCCGVSNN